MKIANKIKRNSEFIKSQKAKSKAKLEKRIEIKKQEEIDPSLKATRLAQNIPSTIDNTRVLDLTIVDPEDPEIQNDQSNDEFSNYFTNNVVPKLLVTTSKRPSKNAYEFAQEFCSLFPGAQFVKRGSQFEIKKIVDIAIKREFTTVIVVNEDQKKPNGITFITLPSGPTLDFKLTSFVPGKEIYGHGKMTNHQPELILNNFNTRLGHTVGRMFASLFPKNPEFDGRQVATIHNQRDFIFFRRHRYMINDEKDKCNLQEIGPRFTLKLRSLQKGTFDTKYGEYEWVFNPEMETSRRHFFL